jgi:transposase
MKNKPHSPLTHPNATTSTAIRFAIQTAPKEITNSELARRFDISPTTVARWRKRDSIQDRSCAPINHGRRKLTEKNLKQIIKARRKTGLGLDPLNAYIKEKFGIDISRARLAQILKQYKNQEISDIRA